jgi:uncharacterized protein (DUF302 family)
MAIAGIRRKNVEIEHVTIESTRTFAEVRSALESLVPRLDSRIAESMDAPNADHLKEVLEAGPELAIFLWRDHGALLRVAGLTRRALQYEIGNPLTASKMTRWRLPAGLYAPLRVILYENEQGRACFEFDRPSSLFGQFGDGQVTTVARRLDVALERALCAAAD